MPRATVAALLSVVLTASAAAPVSFTVGSFTFTRPDAWGWVAPSSPMRKAELSVPGPSPSESGEVTFFHFGPGQGGGVRANVDRWLGQFRDASHEETVETVGSTRITYVSAAGTFLSGMPGAQTQPKAGYAMRGAILESAGGDVFVKLTGPASVVGPAAETFRAMVAGAAR